MNGNNEGTTHEISRGNENHIGMNNTVKESVTITTTSKVGNGTFRNEAATTLPSEESKDSRGDITIITASTSADAIPPVVENVQTNDTSGVNTATNVTADSEVDKETQQPLENTNNNHPTMEVGGNGVNNHGQVKEREDGELKVNNDNDEVSPHGRYVKLDERLGSGAYKDVWRAYDTLEGMEVAWNVVKLGRVPPSERKRIKTEVKLLRDIEHKNVIKYFSSWVDREKEQIVFITEIMSAGSLKEYLRKNPMIRWNAVKRWCKQILKGLDFLHSKQIIHRDIKCDNIFVNGSTGDIRIGDLGLSTKITENRAVQAQSGEIPREITAAAMTCLGTPEFMAPELYEEKYDEKVDVYAFGMTLLEMCTALTPYHQCISAPQIYKKVMKGELPPELNKVKNVNAAAFIKECLQKQEDRPNTSTLLSHPFLKPNEAEDFQEVRVKMEENEEDNHDAHNDDDEGASNEQEVQSRQHTDDGDDDVDANDIRDSEGVEFESFKNSNNKEKSNGISIASNGIEDKKREEGHIDDSLSMSPGGTLHGMCLDDHEDNVSKGSGSISGTRHKGFSRVRRYRAHSDPVAPDEIVLKRSENAVRVVDIRDHEGSKTNVILILRLPEHAEVEFLFDLIDDDPKLIVEEMKADTNLPLTGISASTLLECISPIVELAAGLAMRMIEADRVGNEERSSSSGNKFMAAASGQQQQQGDINDGRGDDRNEKDDMSTQVASSTMNANVPTYSASSSSSLLQLSSSATHDISPTVSLSERILYEILFMEIYLQDEIEVKAEGGSRFECYRSRRHHFESLINIARTINNIDHHRGMSYQASSGNVNRDVNNHDMILNGTGMNDNTSHHTDDDQYSDNFPLVFDKQEQGFQDLLAKWREIFSRAEKEHVKKQSGMEVEKEKVEENCRKENERLLSRRDDLIQQLNSMEVKFKERMHELDLKKLALEELAGIDSSSNTVSGQQVNVTSTDDKGKGDSPMTSHENSVENLPAKVSE